MKVVSTEALTKLIQLVKSAFIKVDDVVEVSEIETETPSEITLATVATTGDYDDLINKPNSLINTATGQYSLTIYGTPTSKRGAFNIGRFSSSLAYGVAYGWSADAGEYGVSIGCASDCNSYGVALGYNASSHNPGSIQIGYGTNSQSMTMAVGFYNGTNSYEYQLLDGTTGLIPSGRLPVDNSSITINSSGQLQATSERNIGEIIQSMLPLTDAGLHLLDGALISGSGSYSAFVTYIASLVSSYPSAFTTESVWQNTVSSKGVCGKFVYDSTNNTVRLPKITGFIEGTTDTTALGELTSAGLPNITGKFTQNDCQVGTYNAGANGAFYMTYENRGYMYGRMSGSENRGDLGFNASRSNSIYGNSNTVQPQSIKALYYIVIATSTKTEIQVDIDEIATDLNGKADTDLANVTDAGKILLSSMGMISNVRTTLTLGATWSYYTAPANGYFALAATSNSGSSNYAHVQLSCMYMVTRSACTAPSARVAVYIPVKKGDSVQVGYQNVTDTNFIFIYAEGSKSEA